MSTRSTRFVVRLASLVLLCGASALVGTHANAEPTPLTAPVLSKVGISMLTAVKGFTCGAPATVPVTINNNNGGYDSTLVGSAKLRAASTPFSVLGMHASTVNAGNGAAFDCTQDLSSTLTLTSAAFTPADFYKQTWAAKSVTYGLSGQKITIVNPNLTGDFSIEVTSATCGSALKLNVVNQLKPVTQGAPAVLKLKVSGNGVDKVDAFKAGSTTAIELGTLNCATGAPTIKLSGPGTLSITELPPTSVAY